MKFIKPSGILAGGIINMINKTAKKLEYSPAYIETLFCQEVDPQILPDPVVTVQTCAKLVRLHMEGKSEQAEEMLKKETARYVKSHQK